MSGVWEALFYEEKQDWISTLVNGASSIAANLVEIPCMLLTALSAYLVLAFDYVCLGATLAADQLGLKEWWGLEHSIWAFMIAQALAVSIKMSKGSTNAFVLRMLYNLQCMLTWGSFLLMLNGLQGGVVFGGKFYHPSLAFVAMTLQIMKLFLSQVKNESDGYEHDAKPSSESIYTCMEIQEKILGYYSSLFLFVATFGLPKLDWEADPTPWMAALPVMAFMYHGPTFMEKLSKSVTPDANGSAVAIEGASEEPAKAEEADPVKSDPAKPTEEPAKPAEEKQEPGSEKPAEPEVSEKVNLCSVALQRLSGLCSRCVSMVNCLTAKACCSAKLACCKISALPWPAIFEVVVNLGIASGMTLSYWNLTEDKLVFAAPALALLAPMILAKLEARNWLDSKGIHLASALLKTLSLSAQYYIFRTYISQPI